LVVINRGCESCGRKKLATTFEAKMEEDDLLK